MIRRALLLLAFALGCASAQRSSDSRDKVVQPIPPLPTPDPNAPAPEPLADAGASPSTAQSLPVCEATPTKGHTSSCLHQGEDLAVLEYRGWGSTIKPSLDALHNEERALERLLSSRTPSRETHDYLRRLGSNVCFNITATLDKGERIAAHRQGCPWTPHCNEGWECQARAYERLVEQFPKSNYLDEAFYVQALAHDRCGRLEIARRFLTLVLELTPKSWLRLHARYGLATILHREAERAGSSLKDALTAYEQALATDVSKSRSGKLMMIYGRTACLAGETAESLGETRRARAAYQKYLQAVRANPKSESRWHTRLITERLNAL